VLCQATDSNRLIFHLPVLDSRFIKVSYPCSISCIPVGGGFHQSNFPQDVFTDNIFACWNIVLWESDDPADM